MNYGKNSTLKKRKDLTSRSTMMGTRAHVSFLRVLFISLLTLGVVCICLGVGAVKGIIDNAPKASEVNITPLGEATFIYDDQGNRLQKLTAPDSNRLPVSIDQIPEDLQHATVAIEDERFYEHNGIDVRGILRAFFKGVSSGGFSEGASTITQQLLKNNVFTNWTDESTWVEKFTRKFQEQYLAIQVEKEINNKDVILENYLNTINLGAGAYGVQAAAHRYFNKDVWDLNLSECATIAGITQNPTAYNPIIYPEKNADRREDVLEHMLDQGYITQEEFDEALNDNVYARIQETEVQTANENKVYSYFTDELTAQVIDALQTQKGYSEKDAYNKLYSGGLQIFSTQDPTIQQYVDEAFDDPNNFPYGVQYSLDFALTTKNPAGEEVNYSKEMMTLYFKNQDPSFDLLFDSPEEGQGYVDQYKAAIFSDGSEQIAERISFTPQPQASMVIIDQHTGYVKAIRGGRGQKSASLTLNRATDTLRQPGSTFKIVSTYAPALDGKGKTLASVYKDEPYKYENGAPVNNANRSYGGDTSIRKAIQNSVNVVAVKCLTEITPQYAYEYLKNFGFTTVIEREVQENGDIWSDLYQPMALGGLTRGVSNLELCASYAAIANSGKYIKPVFFTKILDADGNVLIDNTTPPSRTVIKESTAYLLTSAMEDVVKYGTGTACRLNNSPVAGKTGTTESYNDVWFAGYTPYYTCTTWAGYDNNEKLPGNSRDYHKVLWRVVMNRIHENLPYEEFQQPSTVEKASVCTISGMPPRSGCPTAYELVDTTAMSTQRCDQHYYSNYNSNNNYNNNYSNSNNYNSYDDDDSSYTPEPTQTPDSGDDSTGGDDYDDGSGDTGSTDTGGDSSGDTGGGDSGADTGGDSGGDSGDGGGITDEDPAPPE